MKDARVARRDRLSRALAPVVAGLALAPATVAAHGFGRLYNLPVPFWLYAWAAASTLVLSFLALLFFAGEAKAEPAAVHDSRAIGEQRWVRMLRRLRPALRLLSALLLVLTIATGLFGNRDPFHNFSMTFFWVVFLLGFTYLTAILGDLWSVLNPWRVMADAAERLRPGITRGRLRYPQSLGDWPALAFYLGFVWLELFSRATPPSLATALLAYSGITFTGIGLFGSAAWFRHAEFFSVFLRLIALHAPLDHRPEAPVAQRLRLRPVFAGLVRERATRLGTVVFALAMLSTTAFDGLRATQWWVRLFWADRTGLVTALAGVHPLSAYTRLRSWYVAWESLCLVVLPFVYFAAYLACLALAKALTRSVRPLRELALDFGYTLLPIALVYHATHYATLLLTQGLKILNLVSDPFGFGWDLFGTASRFRAPILPDMGTVWHTQVGLILAGHVISLVVAHRVAQRIWGTRGQVLLSQLPMLLLMVAFTVAGLWILAQPLTVELMR